MTSNNSLRNLTIAASTGLLLLASCRSSSTDNSSALYKRYRPRPTTLAQPAPKYTSREAVSVQYAVARSLEEEKNWIGAERAYLHILQQNPKHADSAHRLAILYDRQNRFQESDKYFKKALKLRPGAPNLFCDIGYSYYRQRRWADAEMMLKQATAIDKTHARAHNHLGLLYAQLDRPTDSLSEFKLAGCNQAQAHMNIGLVLSLNDRLLDAQKQYQIALNVDPTSDEIRSRMQKLESVIAKSAPNQRPHPTPNPVRVARHHAKLKAANLRHADRRMPEKAAPTNRAPQQQSVPKQQKVNREPKRLPSSRPTTQPAPAGRWHKKPAEFPPSDRSRPVKVAPPAEVIITPRRVTSDRRQKPSAAESGTTTTAEFARPNTAGRVAPGSARVRQAVAPIPQAGEDRAIPVFRPIKHEEPARAGVFRATDRPVRWKTVTVPKSQPSRPSGGGLTDLEGILDPTGTKRTRRLVIE